MRTLPETSLDVYWKLMEKAWITNPEAHYYWELEVRYLSQLASLNEAAALRVLDLNLLDSLESGESASMKFLLDLALKDMAGFWSFLSTPELTAVTESGQEEVIPLLYLNTQDSESAAVIESLFWVRDGIGGFEMWSIGHLTNLSLQSQTVFHALLSKERNWLPPDLWIDVDSLRFLVSISAIDEAAAAQILEMPFLETIELADYNALKRLSELAELDPSFLAKILAHPDLGVGALANAGLTISILFLHHTSPQVANAIISLPWVQDGINEPPSESQPDHQSTTAYEHATVSDLLELADRSPELTVSLLTKQWMHEPTNYLKWRMVSQLAELASQDVETALQVVRMAFLDDLQMDDEAALEMMNILGRANLVHTGQPARDSLQQMLAHPDFINLAAGEVTGEISGNVAIIIIQVTFPKVAKVLNSYPWIQDGIDASEFTSMNTLAVFVFQDSVTIYSDEVIWVLIDKPWVRDGLTEDEVDAVERLQALAQREESIAISLLSMPFLESVDVKDAKALTTLSVLSSQRDPEYVRELLSHPSLKDGITDAQAAILAVSYWQLRESLEILDTLFGQQNT